MKLTKDELLAIFGKIDKCALVLGRSRQSIYQNIRNGEVSEQLTDTIIGWCIRNDVYKLPDRFLDLLTSTVLWRDGDG